MKKLGELLKEKRKELGLSQKLIAMKIDGTVSLVAGWESDDYFDKYVKKVTLKAILRICKAYELNVYDVMNALPENKVSNAKAEIEIRKNQASDKNDMYNVLFTNKYTEHRAYASFAIAFASFSAYFFV